MKLSPTMRSTLRTIIRRTTGKGRRGLLVNHFGNYRIRHRTVLALFNRELVTSRRTRYGRGISGYREVICPTAAGREALADC